MPDTIIKQFNKYRSTRKGLIQKALTSAAGVAQALVPEKLEEVITNTIVRLSPELAVIKAQFDNQKFHEFNRLTALPAAGGAMGENAITPTRQAAYARDEVELKIIRRKGAVTNFLQDASAKYIDAASAEMENHLISHVFDLATYLLYGNKAADAYAYDGLDFLVQTNRTNEAQGGAVPGNLGFLDDMIDENLERQGQNHDKVFLMSPKMLSKVSTLLTNVRLNQGLTSGGLTQVDIAGGWRLNAYRDIPIITTSAVRPKSTMGTVGTATATSGGTVPDDEYFIRVAAITYDGEQEASAEVSQVTTGGNTSTLTLSWTAVTGALYYKIYCGLTTAVTPLVLVISAFTYDAAGTVSGTAVTGHVFTTNPSTPNAATVPTLLQSDLPLVATATIRPEIVGLWDLDPYQGLGKVPYTNTAGSRFNGLVTINPLAITDDNLPFLIKSYLALCPSFEATSIWHRGLRVA